MMRINNHEFIFIGNEFDPVLYKYNIQHNEWKKLTEFPEFLYFHCFAMTPDFDNQLLYIGYSTNSRTHKLTTIDTKDWIFSHDKDIDIEPMEHILNIKGTIHGFNGNKHYIFQSSTDSKKCQKFVEINEYDIYISNVMYKSSTNSLLLFGNHRSYSSSIDKMLEYSLSDGIKLLSLDLPKFWMPPDILMTTDEQYVLMLNASMSRYIDKIQVIDMRDTEYCIKRIYLTIPCDDIEEMQYKENVVQTFGGYKHDLLLDGWLRNLYQLSEFDGVKMVSKDVMSLILLWLRKEMIHWIGREGKTRQHFASFIDFIL